ncbi:conserved hypothetical protein [metagenome]|uniref:DUF222 domain-containing protein n=1 Tax=metagenome TaxID=256318 RepID=A0A2P2BZW0_9ZZZZ
MEPAPLDTLDAAGLLARQEQVLVRRRAVEVEDLLVAAQWAVLHGEDPAQARAFGERWVQVGGPGTPRVREFCVAELATVRRVHPVACHKVLGDVLDLQHRLPSTWALVESLRAEVWVARRVAAMTRALPVAGAALVDQAVSAAIEGLSPSRVFELVQAKIIEADPLAHEARLEEQRRRRFVTLGRCDEFGLRHLIARVSAGDAVWLEAMLERVADLLAPGHPDATREELRSEAMGWLARPAELITLLLHASGPQHAEDLTSSRTTAVPAEVLATLRAVDPAKLRPRAVIYLHLHQAAITGTTTGSATGVARAEGLGPVLVGQVGELLRGAHVTVTPVLDLAEQISVAAYEHPEAVKDRVWLTAGGDYFPHTASPGHRDRVDFDHPVPFVPPARGGPPGQTGTHNSGPLTRTHHRIKTHAGWHSRQTGPGEYVWRTPHGHYRLIDHRGTHIIPTHVGEVLLSGRP